MQDCRFPIRLYKPRNLWILSYHGILFEDSKKYIDRSQFWQTQYFMYIILKIIWGVSHHIACHLLDWIWDISSRLQEKETAGIGLWNPDTKPKITGSAPITFQLWNPDTKHRITGTAPITLSVVEGGKQTPPHSLLHVLKFVNLCHWRVATYCWSVPCKQHQRALKNL